jgi:hypothetical protein
MNLLDPKLKDIPTLVKQAMAHQMPESPVDQLIVEWTKKHLSNCDADASEAVNWINFVIDQQARQQRTAAGASQADSADDLVGRKRGSKAVAGLEGRRKRVQREGAADIPNEG